MYAGTLKRVTSIGFAGSPFVDITRTALGRPEIITWYNSYAPEAAYTNIYDASGRYLKKQLGPRAEQVRGYGYHPVITNLLVSVTNALGEVLRYTHDTNTMKVTSIAFPSGLVRTNIYFDSGPSKGILCCQADLGFRTNYFTYESGNLFVTTNELGLVTTNTGDALNRLISTAYPDGTTVSNLYKYLDLVATKDRLGNWTRYDYNAVHQLTFVTNALGQVTQYDYCGCGSPSVIARWNGASALATQFTYDLRGRLTNTAYADGYQVNRGYDVNSLLASVSDSGGRRLDFDYNIMGLQYAPRHVYAVSPSEASRTLLTQTFDEYGRFFFQTLEFHSYVLRSNLGSPRQVNVR